MQSKYNYSNICPYQQYYNHQAGSGIGVIYKGVAHQRGHGIGSFLGGLFRSVLPLFSSGAKVIGKEAMNAGVGLLSDMMQSKPLDESLKTRFKEATSNLKRKADDKLDRMMTGTGHKNKRLRSSHLNHERKSVKTTLKKLNNLNYSDIFSKK